MTKTDPTFKALVDDRAKANERIEQLEHLCRCMYVELLVMKKNDVQQAIFGHFRNWMVELGLLEG